jgi:hypothetical protein
MRPESPSSGHRHGLISAVLSFGKRRVVIIAGLFWIVLSIVLAAAVASSARSADHWLGAFCLYAVIFALLPVVPFFGWIERRRKREYLRHHSDSD